VTRGNIPVVLTDTTPEAEAVQLDILGKMSGAQRILLAFEMSELTRELARAGIRRDHPDWSERRITQELIRLAFMPEQLPAWLEDRLRNER
jgi:Rv0078B-related antitoxin